LPFLLSDGALEWRKHLKVNEYLVYYIVRSFIGVELGPEIISDYY
jgi:hypothetical protein